MSGSAGRPAPAGTIRDSPLWTGEHDLSGRIVTHPLEVDAIARETTRVRPRPALVLALLVAGLTVGGVAPRLVVAVLLSAFALSVYLLVLARKAHP